MARIYELKINGNHVIDFELPNEILAYLANFFENAASNDKIEIRCEI